MPILRPMCWKGRKVTAWGSRGTQSTGLINEAPCPFNRPFQAATMQFKVVLCLQCPYCSKILLTPSKECPYATSVVGLQPASPAGICSCNDGTKAACALSLLPSTLQHPHLAAAAGLIRMQPVYLALLSSMDSHNTL